MSHHIVTVCVVCVLCSAHVHCSAHTNSSAMTYSDNSTSSKNHSGPDTGGQPFWSLIRSKDVHPYSKNQQRYNSNNFTSNKHDAVRSHIMRHIDSNNNNSIPVTANASSTASHVYRKKEMTGSSKGGESSQNTIRSADVSVNSRDAELLERLAQTELVPGVKQKSAQSSEDLRTVRRSRLKRDVNERYFMQKIFEAYGDGTSITMEGFEKLVRKLGLLRLLTDVSKVDGDGTDRSMYKKHITYNNRYYMLKEDELIDKANFLHVTDSRNFPSKGLYDTDSKNNKERVR